MNAYFEVIMRSKLFTATMGAAGPTYHELHIYTLVWLNLHWWFSPGTDTGNLLVQYLLVLQFWLVH